MKKIFLSVAVVGMAFVLSGCGAKTTPQDGGMQNKKEESKAGSAISSIKDAMGLGAKMKCEYSMGTGAEAVKSNAYVEGKKYKSVATVNGITMNAIFDGDVMYSWQEGQKTGMKMTMSCVEELNKSLPKDQQDSQEVKAPDEAFEDAIDTSCMPTTESVSFSAPAGVEFQDQCEMLKGFMNMKDNLPSDVGAKMPNTPNMPDLPNIPGQ